MRLMVLEESFLFTLLDPEPWSAVCCCPTALWELERAAPLLIYSHVVFMGIYQEL